jgi:hypothetical protein
MPYSIDLYNPIKCVNDVTNFRNYVILVIPIVSTFILAILN